jgi:hypothetical protein
MADFWRAGGARMGLRGYGLNSMRSPAPNLQIWTQPGFATFASFDDNTELHVLAKMELERHGQGWRFRVRLQRLGLPHSFDRTNSTARMAAAKALSAMPTTMPCPRTAGMRLGRLDHPVRERQTFPDRSEEL